jgi:hypothetical protein
MAFNSHLIAGTTIRTGVAISRMLQIDGFLGLVPTHSSSLLHLEVAVVTSAIYSGLHQELNGVAHRVKVSMQANKILCTPLPRSLVGRHKSLSTLMKMTIPSDLRKICKWRMKRKGTRWPPQENTRVMTINKKMLRSSPLRSNRKHLRQHQLNLHQICLPG